MEPVIRGTPTATVTVEVALPTLPLESLKLKVTVVVPTGNRVVLVTPTPPACGGICTGAGVIFSAAVAPARNAARAGHAAAVAPVAWVAGMEMLAGAVTSGDVARAEITSLRAEDVLGELEPS